MERSKPKNDIGINLNIVNCSSGEKNIKKSENEVLMRFELI